MEEKLDHRGFGAGAIATSIGGLVLCLLFGAANTALAQAPPHRGPIIEPAMPDSQRPQAMPRGAIPETPPAVREAQQRLDECVAANQRAFKLFRASTSVVAVVRNRDEMKKTGERMNWKLATADNYRNAERTLAEHFARYSAFGGTASTPEAVVPAADPCRDHAEKLNAAVREAYGGKPSPVTRSAVRIGPPAEKP